MDRMIFLWTLLLYNFASFKMQMHANYYNSIFS
jgi:hypothetical protein